MALGTHEDIDLAPSKGEDESSRAGEEADLDALDRGAGHRRAVATAQVGDARIGIPGVEGEDAGADEGLGPREATRFLHVLPDMSWQHRGQANISDW
jgi:hypothetical protein